jgi:hypothetical protein
MGWAAGLVLQSTTILIVLLWAMVVGKKEVDHPGHSRSNHIFYYRVFSFLMSAIYISTNIALISVFATTTSTTKEAWWSRMWIAKRLVLPFEQQDDHYIGTKHKKDKDNPTKSFRRLIGAFIIVQAGFILGPGLTLVAIHYVMLGSPGSQFLMSLLTNRHVLVLQLLVPPLYPLLRVCSEILLLYTEQEPSSVTENSTEQQEEAEDTTMLIV